MRPVRRWLDDPNALPSELQQALAGEQGGPDTEQLRQLTQQLAVSLGVSLLPPPPISGVETIAAGKVGAAGAISAAKPLVVLGAWVLGGVVLGAGLSGLARDARPTDGPAPRAHADSSAPSRLASMPVEASLPTARPSLPSLPSSEPATAVAPPVMTHRRSEAAAPAEPIAPAESEVQLLKRAQLALAADPDLALSLTRAHAVRFPRAALDQEREMIAIDALRRLGQIDEAKRRAEAFRARYPRSAHLHRLEGLLEDSSP